MESLKKFRDTLENKTAKDIIGDDFKLIDIGSQENVLKALETLQKHNVSSLPVFYEKTHNYFGSISLQDLAVVIYVMAVTKSFVDLFAEEVVEWKEYDNEEFKLFAEEKIEEFVNASERNSWALVKKSTPVLEIMKILSNPAQSEVEKEKKNIVRVGVEDENGKLVGVISQYGLIEYLIKEINSNKSLFEGLKIDDLLKKTKEELFTIKETDVACEGFRLMLEKQITGVGVVNEKGQLTSVFSSHDIKRVNLEENLFKDFRLTVKEYLSKSKRYFEKEVNEDAVVLHKDDTFLHLLDKIKKYHLHSIFSVDENKIPIKAISLCDIIKSLLK